MTGDAQTDPSSTALDILRRHGLGHLILRIIGNVYRNFLRTLLPTIGYPKTGFILERKSGNRRGTRKPLDRFLPENFHYSADAKPYYFSQPLPIDSEFGLQVAHRGLTQKDDHVVVIGGGRGLSSTVAAKQVGENGKVTIYDAKPRSDTMDTNLSINNVRDRCELHRAIVISDPEIRSAIQRDLEEGGAISVVDPTNLPDCDVIEFDCTGSELDIIRNLAIRPRLMIVEVEAFMYESIYEGEEHPMDLLEEISELGYKIIQQTDHIGNALTYEELENHVNTIYELETRGLNAKTEAGVHSPIICAIREDYQWEN